MIVIQTETLPDDLSINFQYKKKVTLLPSPNPYQIIFFSASLVVPVF
jgi:hypothetical protein